MASKQQILNDIRDGKSPVDLVKLMEVQNTLTALKNNPNTVALDQLIETKKAMSELISAAPGFSQLLTPYIKKLDEGIIELSNNKTNE